MDVELENNFDQTNTNNSPSETLYIHNLNERIPKKEIRMGLYAIFSDFGTIIDLVHINTLKMKGQAFITYTSVESAIQAKRALENVPFQDKQLKIDFAKEKSDVLSELEGQAVKREEKRANKPPQTRNPSGNKKRKEERPQFHSGNNMPLQSHPNPMPSKPKPNNPHYLQPRAAPPNNILFVENLSDDVTDDLLTILFQQYDGFKEVRLVRGKGVIAFVEYELENQAALAMEALQHFKIPPKNNLMVISYAKK